MVVGVGLTALYWIDGDRRGNAATRLLTTTFACVISHSGESLNCGKVNSTCVISRP